MGLSNKIKSTHSAIMLKMLKKLTKITLFQKYLKKLIGDYYLWAVELF